MKKRVLGRSGIEVSPMGLGCWAIGGQFYFDGKIDGYGNTDDKESIKAIHTALDLGVDFLDTADAYGIGHSEQLIGEALEGRRDEVIIATKFGFFGNEATKTLHGTNITPDYIERACEASLRRLRTDYIDLYQLHVGEIGLSEVDFVADTLDRLVAKGKIRTYGWSTDNLNAVKLMSDRVNCSAIQHQCNVVENNPKMIQLCEEQNFASINRSPLAMGLLSGKFNKDSFISKDDVRGAGHTWAESAFKDGRPNKVVLGKLDAIRDILTSGGRTLVQGALAWLWAVSDVTLPIPGFKTVKQIEENVKSMEFGPLTKEQVKSIDDIIKSLS
ncbi:aldo/keto reductase [Mobilitalea sibirica]|uniref:Aldo/keto reductase n=1 Tax=Mobilitalea sibirica TaxID=1462919 RepID=A0A8J7H4Y5_9FIRM|nr:aldo/keto reductase [Mobilitalea sibirica]MBH1942167.1 aldo/keto reductase [Mobilitalea sibirica]